MAHTTRHRILFHPDLDARAVDVLTHDGDTVSRVARLPLEAASRAVRALREGAEGGWPVEIVGGVVVPADEAAVAGLHLARAVLAVDRGVPTRD